MKRTPNPKVRKRKPTRIVRLQDLAPREVVMGGAGRLLFGERLQRPEPADSTRDQSPQRPPKEGSR